MASLGVIARAPSEAARFVPLPEEVLGLEPAALVDRLRQALTAAFGWEDAMEPEEVRVLYREKELETTEVAKSLREAMSRGRPCMVRILFKLLGGKGGFGALLKKQMSLGKKTTNFDAMRDLSGRRLRHSKAVDRIKDWMEAKKREDDAVKALTGEGPEMPKPVPASESLNEDFVESLQRGAANKKSLVRQGLLKQDAGEASAASSSAAAASSSGPESKRARLAASTSSAMLRASLGEVSSPSSDPDAAGSGSEQEAEQGQSSGAAASSGGAAASTKELASVAAAAAAAEEEKEAEDEGTSTAAAAAPAAAATAAASSSAPEVKAAKAAPPPPPATPPDDGGMLTLADVAKFPTAEVLASKVHMEKVKRTLQNFGLKCGGKAEERAARLFLLKTTKKEDLPKSVLAPPPKTK